MDDSAGRVGLAAIARAVLSAPGRRAVAGRVVAIEGFSTWPGDELVVIDETGAQHGDVLGRPGARQVQHAFDALLASDPARLGSVVVEIHGADVTEAGLSCGGRAELLLQPTAAIPSRLWDRLAERAPVALLTRIDGPDGGPAAVVVEADGTTTGTLVGDAGEAVAEAVGLLAGGHSATRQLPSEGGTLLVEAWIPTPRLVVIGTGDLVEALSAQAGLLGWATTAVADRPAVAAPQPDGPSDDGVQSWPALDEALDWAGASAALVVLSHDPHVDVAALATALDRGVAYVGAMGSRRTQSRRLARLTAIGVPDAALERIHRPIGLDLGGRSAPEVALAISAEILAVHCGRDGGHLRDREGPINDRPTGARAAGVL